MPLRGLEEEASPSLAMGALRSVGLEALGPALPSSRGAFAAGRGCAGPGGGADPAGPKAGPLASGSCPPPRSLPVAAGLSRRTGGSREPDAPPPPKHKLGLWTAPPTRSHRVRSGWGPCRSAGEGAEGRLPRGALRPAAAAPPGWAGPKGAHPAPLLPLAAAQQAPTRGARARPASWPRALAAPALLRSPLPPCSERASRGGEEEEAWPRGRGGPSSRGGSLPGRAALLRRSTRGQQRTRRGERSAGRASMAGLPARLARLGYNVAGGGSRVAAAEPAAPGPPWARSRWAGIAPGGGRWCEARWGASGGGRGAARVSHPPPPPQQQQQQPLSGGFGARGGGGRRLRPTCPLLRGASQPPPLGRGASGEGPLRGLPPPPVPPLPVPAPRSSGGARHPARHGCALGPQPALRSRCPAKRPRPACSACRAAWPRGTRRA